MNTLSRCSKRARCKDEYNSYRMNSYELGEYRKGNSSRHRIHTYNTKAKYVNMLFATFATHRCSRCHGHGHRRARDARDRDVCNRDVRYRDVQDRDVCDRDAQDRDVRERDVRYRDVCDRDVRDRDRGVQNISSESEAYN